jgi:hypothetical protein
VHDSKPRVCALFPIARIFRPDTGDVMYANNGAPCGASGKSTTLRKWLAAYNIPEHDEPYLAWSNFLINACKLMKRINDLKWKDTTKQMLWNLFLGLIYFNYDIEKDYLPQFEKNTSEFKKIMQGSGLIK